MRVSVGIMHKPCVKFSLNLIAEIKNMCGTKSIKQVKQGPALVCCSTLWL